MFFLCSNFDDTLIQLHVQYQNNQTLLGCCLYHCQLRHWLFRQGLQRHHHQSAGNAIGFLIIAPNISTNNAYDTRPLTTELVQACHRHYRGLPLFTSKVQFTETSSIVRRAPPLEHTAEQWHLHYNKNIMHSLGPRQLSHIRLINIASVQNTEKTI